MIRKIISIITIVAFFSAELLWAHPADRRFCGISHIRSQQPAESDAAGKSLANAFGIAIEAGMFLQSSPDVSGEFVSNATGRVVADARELGRKVWRAMYYSAPLAFAATLWIQLILPKGVPWYIALAGTILAFASVVAGSIIINTKYYPSKKFTRSVAAIFTVFSLAFSTYYMLMGGNLLHNIREEFTRIIEFDRSYGVRKSTLAIMPPKYYQTGLIYQRAEVQINGLVKIYNDKVFLVGINRQKLALGLAAAPQDTGASVRQLLGNGVCTINGSYYDKRFRPTGLVIQDGKELYPFNEPGIRGSLNAIFVYAGNKPIPMIVPASYYQERRYPFNGAVPIKFALQAGPLAMFEGNTVKLARHFSGDGRSLSAIAIDDKDNVYFVLSEGIKGLVGPEYSQTIRFVSKMIQEQNGTTLAHMIFLDSGGSSRMIFDKGDKNLVLLGPGYHLVANAVVATPRVDIEPVDYLVDLMKQNDVKAAIEAIGHLSRTRSQEDLAKILLSITAARPQGLKHIFSVASDKWLSDLFRRHPQVVNIAAELTPRKVLKIYGVNKYSSPSEFADGINRLAGLTIRPQPQAESEFIAALKLHNAKDGILLLNGLNPRAWQWLGGLQRFLKIYPELINLFRQDIPGAVNIMSISANGQPNKFVTFLIGQYSSLADQKNLDFIFAVMKELYANHFEQFREVAKWLLLSDINISRSFLESYLGVYGYDATAQLIEIGLEDTKVEAIYNLQELAAQSQPLRPVIEPILKKQKLNYDEKAERLPWSSVAPYIFQDTRRPVVLTTDSLPAVARAGGGRGDIIEINRAEREYSRDL